MMPKNNELVHMTRRYPKLRRKVLLRDSKIASKLIRAWDFEKNEKKVIDIYLKEKDNLSNERYWELMRTVWIMCGSINNSELFKYLMQSRRPKKHYFSTPEESKKLREMPDKFNVFRACNENDDGGLSWTISREYAEGYRLMYQKKKVIERIINKSDVFAFIERNKESEVIILR